MSKSRRHFHVEDAVWNELLAVAAFRTREEGQHVPAAELVRRGVMRELEEHHTPRSLYKHPRSLDAIRKMGND